MSTIAKKAKLFLIQGWHGSSSAALEPRSQEYIQSQIVTGIYCFVLEKCYVNLCAFNLSKILSILQIIYSK